MINEDAKEVPVALEIAGWYDDTGRMMGRFVFRLQTSQCIVGWYDCKLVFKRWEKILTDEFGTELFLVGVEVPAQLLGSDKR